MKPIVVLLLTGMLLTACDQITGPVKGQCDYYKACEGGQSQDDDEK